jgi:formate dehydrogenase major subunit
MQLSRRGFIKITAAGLAASSLGALGFGGAGEALAASVRPFKLTAATETRNTCTYCSVACGILIYSLGDKAKNAVSDITHIEGDPDHPVNRGTLCPGPALETFVIDLGDLVFVGRSAGEPMRRRHLDRDAIDIGDRRLDRGDRVVGARV